MRARLPTVPDLAPGVTVLWAPPRSTAPHQVALSALHDRDGTARWLDARDTASTPLLSELATPRTLRRLAVARAWTAYQHHELVRRLPGEVDARTELVVLPAVASLYEDDDIPSPEDRLYLRSTLGILGELARVADLAVLVSTARDAPFVPLVEACADHEIAVERTPLGHRFVAEGFETTVYWGEGFWQTTIPYWVDLLGAAGTGLAESAYEAGLVDAEV